MPREVRGNKVRERKIHPLKCDRNSFRTLKRGRSQLIVCCPKGKWKRGRCSVGMKLQSIVKTRKKRR